MNQIELKALLETSWRRPLAPSEEKAIRDWCRENPGSSADVEADLELSRSLHQLPDVAVPSNFMSRVWQEVDRAEVPTESREAVAGTWFSHITRWLPRLAVCGALASVMWLGWWQHDSAQRAEVAAGVEVVSESGEAPDPAMLKEFDAIQMMSQASAPPDVELLSALQ